MRGDGFKFYFFISSIATFLFISCEEVVPWDLGPAENDQIVVEAILTNENVIQQVRLSKSFDHLRGTAEPVTDAIVTVNSIDGEVHFNDTPLLPGIYRSSKPFAARKDVLYQLEIIWNNEEYTASESLSFVSPLERVRFSGFGPDSLTLPEIGSLYHPLQQAMYEVHVFWHHINPSDASWARMYFYTFSTIDGNELIRPEKEKVYFPVGSIVLVKKFGLSEGFASYLRSLVMETEWQGSAFDEASSSLPTNISNDGLGFFSVCSVLSDTLLAR